MEENISGKKSGIPSIPDEILRLQQIADAEMVFARESIRRVLAIRRQIKQLADLINPNNN